MVRFAIVPLASAALLALSASSARAAFSQWSVDQSQSSATIDTSVSYLPLGLLNVGSQVPGTSDGLVAHFGGLFSTAPVDPASTQLFFASGGLITFDSGSWGPAAGGTPTFAPANFGIFGRDPSGPTGSFFAALRNFVLSFSGVNLAGAGSSFTGPPTFTLFSGAMDYFSNGSLALIGSGTVERSEFNFSSSRGVTATLDFDDPLNPTQATMTLDFQYSLIENIVGPGGFANSAIFSATVHGHVVATAVAVPELGGLWLVSLPFLVLVGTRVGRALGFHQKNRMN